MGQSSPREGLKSVHRVVVKLGSTTVSSPVFSDLMEDLQACRERGVEVVIVTSGAVAAGMKVTGAMDRPTVLAEIQALAAVGQAAVMGWYNEAFSRHGVHCAQLLLTHEGISHRKHLLNIRRTFDAVLSRGIVPVVNENDTVAVEELRFGDNDRLASALASVVEAGAVILLSDIDALYDGDPRQDEGARPIPEVMEIDQQIRSVAQGQGTDLGTGGMASKVAAAELSMAAGIPLIVASGSETSVVSRLLSGEALGTCFNPKGRIVGRRRHWIGFLSKIQGSVTVDPGAVVALKDRGSSLLSIGVTGVEGVFDRGDAVAIVGPEGAEVGRGIVGYGSAELDLIAGSASDEAARILNVTVGNPVIHRNDLLLTDATD
ncbi:MAG: glutamate 5-kinase [Myxococcota bacterium]|nr:glutamate 5-kinase [Myxococcota bacterium]